MSTRTIYIDRAPGEIRAVLAIDERPERLLIHRDGDVAGLMLGARSIARVASVEPALMTAFLDLGGGQEAILPFKPDARPVRGDTVEIEIRGEARRGKVAVARLLSGGEGAPRLLQPPPSPEDQLRGLAKEAEVVEGADARRMADEAQSEALETIHALPGGGSLAIETTRALTAIDVDLGERKGPDAKRVTRRANLEALSESARLLRLKSLGGIVVIDLVGRGHDAAGLLAHARIAFGPDNPGVAIDSVGRFGTMQISLPRRRTPLTERLLQADGRLTDLTLAYALVRRLEEEGRAQPGARLEGSCSKAVAEHARPLIAQLAGRMGGRFALTVDDGRTREAFSVSTR